MTRVLIDVDGVLADFTSRYLELIKDATGLRFGYDEVTGYPAAVALGLTKEQSESVNRSVSIGFASSLDPLPGAIDAMHRLEQIADVYIVTSPWNSCETWVAERERWLRVHFDIPHSRVLHGSAKHLIAGDVLVDDRFETCCKWRDAHPGKTAVLWEQPWNRGCAWAGVMTSDWNRLIKLVESISG